MRYDRGRDCPCMIELWRDSKGVLQREAILAGEGVSGTTHQEVDIRGSISTCVSDALSTSFADGADSGEGIPKHD